MTIDNLHNFIKNLLTKIHIECFVHGNATKNKAIELAFIVEQKYTIFIHIILIHMLYDIYGFFY